jgi:hypothetical protein
VNGNIRQLLASYSLGCAMQFVDIADQRPAPLYSALLVAIRTRALP